MLVFRSFAIGLSAACFALLVMRPTVELRVAEAPPLHAHAAALRYHPSPRTAEPIVPVPTIIDAAPGITASQLAAAIRLEPGEQIVTVDEVAVDSDLDAGIVLASRDLRSRDFIDLGVTGPEGNRRVLVLLH